MRVPLRITECTQRGQWQLLDRSPLPDRSVEQSKLTRACQVCLLGIAVQCLHFLEKYLAGFQRVYPPMLGLDPWSDPFFVSLNLPFIALLVLAAAGFLYQLRLAYFVVWFFAIAMFGNGVVYPVVSVMRGAYLPGTITAPIHLVVAIILIEELLTLRRTKSPPPK